MARTDEGLRTMLDLPEPWRAYARLQEKLARTRHVDGQTWGLETRYIGKVGEDDAGRLHKREFERTGVDARLITVPNAASPQSLIIVDEGGERTVLCRRDERLLLQPSDLQRDWIVSARALHVDGFETAAATEAKLAIPTPVFPVLFTSKLLR